MDGIFGIDSLSSAARTLRPNASAPVDALISRQEDFAAVIARARTAGAAATADPDAAAQHTAQEFVAFSLVQPLLKQLRQNSQAAEPFAPSGAELEFRGLLDAQLSQKIVRARNMSVVDAVATSLRRARAPQERESQIRTFPLGDDGKSPTANEGGLAIPGPMGPLPLATPPAPAGEGTPPGYRIPNNPL